MFRLNSLLAVERVVRLRFVISRPQIPPPPLLLLVLLSLRSFVFFIEFFWSTRFYIKYIHLSLFIVRPRVCIYGMEPIKTLRTIANRDFTTKLFAFIKPKKLKCIFSDPPPQKKRRLIWRALFEMQMVIFALNWIMVTSSWIRTSDLRNLSCSQDLNEMNNNANKKKKK